MELDNIVTTGELLSSKSSVSDTTALIHLQNISGGFAIYAPIEAVEIDIIYKVSEVSLETVSEIKEDRISVVEIQKIIEDEGETVNVV